MENRKITLTLSKLLLVEGKDEDNFFDEFLKKTGIGGIQIIPCGGRDNFQNEFLATIRTPGFVEKVESLALIQDADNSAKAAFNRVYNILRRNEFKPPDKHGEFKEDKKRNLKTGVFIIPDGKNSGMLESLCLSSVKSQHINKCIDSFMDCVDKQPVEDNSFYKKKPKNKDKARLRAFLAAMEKDCPSLGVAAQKSYWDFKSPAFKPLLNFLQNI